MSPNRPARAALRQRRKALTHARCCLLLRLLHVVGIAANMGGQLSSRGYENLTLTGAPIDALKQPVLPRMRPERRSTSLLGLFRLRDRHGAMLRQTPRIIARITSI
jgi:hypothetical protein